MLSASDFSCHRMSDTKNPPLVPSGMLTRVARRLKIMGEPVRLELLNLLRMHGELSVQALVDASGQRQANVSKHLGIMMREGLVQRRKEGVKAFYSLADPSIPGICVLITNQLRNETAPSPNLSS
jgi:ArsR family transcriptional regulator